MLDIFVDNFVLKNARATEFAGIIISLEKLKLCITTGEETGGANFFPGGISVGDKVIPMVSRGRLVEIGVF